MNSGAKAESLIVRFSAFCHTQKEEFPIKITFLASFFA
jgi:hypothetical protein